MISMADSGFRIQALSNLDAGISDSGGLREDGGEKIHDGG
jgi:hypothetical protein